jgi:hypothetical protein
MHCRVGFGMVLLQTLTRIYISATLIGAQISGAGVTMLARAVGPTMLGPGMCFRTFREGWGKGERIEKGVILGGVRKSVDYLRGDFEEVSEGAVE